MTSPLFIQDLQTNSWLWINVVNISVGRVCTFLTFLIFISLFISKEEKWGKSRNSSSSIFFYSGSQLWFPTRVSWYHNKVLGVWHGKKWLSNPALYAYVFLYVYFSIFWMIQDTSTSWSNKPQYMILFTTKSFKNLQSIVHCVKEIKNRNFKSQSYDFRT